MDLGEIAREISRRLVRIFLPDGRNGRPCLGGNRLFAEDPRWRDLLLFHEYFHGETGRGLGAGHQTGWTALIVKLLGGNGSTPGSSHNSTLEKNGSRRVSHE